jgi:hypothetical protein
MIQGPQDSIFVRANSARRDRSVKGKVGNRPNPGNTRNELGEIAVKVPVKTVYEDVNFAADRLSTQVRSLTFGTLALAWIFLSKSKDFPAMKITSGNRQMLGISILCVLTLLIDATQYWAYYLSANSLRKTLERKKQDDAEYTEYDETTLLWNLTQASFWAKQTTALIGAAWLLVLVAMTVATWDPKDLGVDDP